MSEIKCEVTGCTHNYYGNCRVKTVNITSQRKCGDYKSTPENKEVNVNGKR